MVKRSSIQRTLFGWQLRIEAASIVRTRSTAAGQLSEVQARFSLQVERIRDHANQRSAVQR